MPASFLACPSRGKRACHLIRSGRPGPVLIGLPFDVQMARRYRVPVLVECMLEKVTDIAVGAEIDNMTEFEDIDCRHPAVRKRLGLAGLLE